MKLSVKISSAYLLRSADLPTPESPMITTFKSWSAPSIAMLPLCPASLSAKLVSTIKRALEEIRSHEPKKQPCEGVGLSSVSAFVPIYHVRVVVMRTVQINKA